MGIIIKESFNQTIIRIVISVIGALGTIFIYPLDRELYGVIGNVLNTSVLLMPFVVLGLGQSSIRFFPYTSSTLTSRMNFLWFLVKILLVNIFLFAILFFALQDQIIGMSKNPSEAYTTYFIYCFPGALMFALVAFLVSYISNFKIVAIPIGLQSMYRVVVPVAFLLVYFAYISISAGLIAIYSALLIAIVMLVYMIWAKINVQDPAAADQDNPVDKKEFFQFYFWAFASSLGAMFAFKIDAFMVPWLTDFTMGGDYMIALTIIGVIIIPTTSVVSIAHPIISQAWKDMDIEKIKSVYSKGSKNLLIIGGSMLLGVLLLLDFLPLVLPKWKDLTHIKLIVLILGIGKLFDMASSVNGVIIAHSKWYRYNTWFVLILVISNVWLNYHMIYIMNLGIIGAALATMISLVIFNVLKSILLFRKINFHPFDTSSFIFAMAFSFVLAINYYAESFLGSISALILNSIISLMFVYATVYIFDFAPDSKNTISNTLEKFRP